MDQLEQENKYLKEQLADDKKENQTLLQTLMVLK